jgi:hypothetical protein
VSSSTITSSLEPQQGDVTLTGDDADRGTWHRTI